MSQGDIQTNEFTWQAHPAAERLGHAVLAALVVLGMVGTIYVSFQSAAWAAVSLVVLVAALNRFFFPSRFTIDDEGISAQYPLTRKHERWENLRRFHFDDNGGYLSTSSRPSRMDAYRGMHILFGEMRQPVVERIQSFMQRKAPS